MEMKYKIFAMAVIFVAVVLAITSVWDDSIIFDEAPHIGAGYSYLIAHDMRINSEHPPLVKDLSAVPLLMLLDKSAFATKAWTADWNKQWEFGQQIIYHSGADAQLVTRVARIPMLLFFILSGILLFKWADERYGRIGGILALAVFAFSPTVMAHARFVTTDVAALFGVLYATYFYIRFLKNPTWLNGFVAAVMFGIALLTKFSTVLLVPSLGLTVVLWGFIQASSGIKNRISGALKQARIAVLIFAVGFIVVVWPAYYFNTYNYPPELEQYNTAKVTSALGNQYPANLVIWAFDKPVLRAAGQYGLGLFMVMQRVAGGGTTFFLGDVAQSGGKKYFPLVYFMKEPLAWWGLIVIALAGMVFQIRKSALLMPRPNQWFRTHFEEVAMSIWLAIYWFMSIRSPLNIGVRHLLPTYPFAILLVSGQLIRIGGHLKTVGLRQFRIFTAVITVLLGWYIFENINTWPYYLTYFNQLFGGPSGGYRYVVDSNLDWGQDLKRFGDWVIANDIKEIELDYFGMADSDYYIPGRRLCLTPGKYRDAADFLARNESNGWIAVSASSFQGTTGMKDSPEPINYLWLRKYTPVTTIGHSIFVWHIH
jgi:hypothetical protein